MGNEPVRLGFSSASFAGPEAVEAFRECYGRAVMNLDIEPIPGHPFHLDFKVVAVPEFSLAVGTLSPTVNRLHAAMIDNDDIILIFSPQGNGSIHQLGREVEVANGGATFASNAEPGLFKGNVVSEMCNFRFSRRMLSGLAVDIDAAIARPIHQGHPVLKLLTSYARIMNDTDALSSEMLRRSVTTHMHDLAALLIGAHGDGRYIAGRRGKRAAQLRAIQGEIERNLTSRDLSPAKIARHYSISERALRDLFKIEETTFTDFVIMRRLELARRQLTDPRYQQLSISEIALASGFGDISHFNHQFRRRYKMTPSEARIGSAP